MKSFKVGLLALMFTVGIGTAVVQKIQAAPKFDDPIYHWTDNNANSDVQAAIDRTGCDGSGDVCTSGTLVSGQPGDPTTATLHFN
jgi:hypothetical protein